MNARILCCIACLALAPACAVATAPNLSTDDTGAGGAQRAGASAVGGALPNAGRAGGGSGTAGKTAWSGAGTSGGSKAGDSSGAGGTGNAAGAQGGSTQGGPAAGSGGRANVSCAPHVFAWADPQHISTSVAVTGSFNAWSTTGSALDYDSNRQRWTLPMSLAPGTYPYKFIIDGGSQWKADPENANTTPDGFGGVNSLVDCQ